MGLIVQLCPGTYAYGRHMKEIPIHAFTEFHEIIENYDARTVIYRGMKSVKFP